MNRIKNKIINLSKFVFKKKLLGEKPENILFIEPNYYIVNNLNATSLTFDIGTGNDANLSQDLIKKFALKSYGFDPTIRHYESLKQVEKETNGRFTLFNFALSDKIGEAPFYESEDNISGSFSTDHVNIKRDKVIKYKVKTTTLKNIFSIVSVEHADIIKIDIEGEEYKVIDSLNKELSDKVSQFIFEFHHHCIDKYSILDTLKSIKRLQSFDYRYYSEDGINYLFYK